MAEALVVRFEGKILQGSNDLNVSTTIGRGVAYEYDDLDGE